MNNITDDQTKTLMPLLRKVVPMNIALELVNVQPMSAEAFGETTEARLIRTEFGGIPKEEIIEILKRERPEMFV